MAFVDFSNAKLHLPTDPSSNITDAAYADLNASPIRNLYGQSIVTNDSYSLTVNEQKKLVFNYTGTFTASGTEFYIGNHNVSNLLYKVTGISFQSGDNYSFEIPVTLTCL